MFTLPPFALLRRMAEPIPFLSPFFPPLKISILGNFNCHHPLWNSKDTSDPQSKHSIGLSLLIFSHLMTLTCPLFSIAHLAVAPPLMFPLPLLSRLFLLMGGASGPGFRSPTNSSACLSLSGLSPQRTSSFL